MHELINKISNIIKGGLGPADGEDRRLLVEENIASSTGRLACGRMLDVIENMVAEVGPGRRPGIGARLSVAEMKEIIKQL